MSGRDRVDVFVDSNCLTYVIEAFEGIGEPSDSLAQEKVALVRAYLYTPGTLWTTSTVNREWKDIRDPAKRARHQSWTSVLFGECHVQDPAAVALRGAEFQRTHRGLNDCMTVAEVEDVGGDVLLTFDKKLVNRLGPIAHVNLTTPARYWRALAIPRGATPCQIPRYDNPLAGQTWWLW